MSSPHKPHDLSPEEKRKNASRDLLRLAEDFCRWSHTTTGNLLPSDMKEAAFDAVRRAGGELPKG